MSSRKTARFALSIAIVSLTFVVGVALSLAGKTTEATFGGTSNVSQGGPGPLGGLFAGPGDVAVDQSTGQIYVADSGNDRIQRFSVSHAFEAAFGRDTIAAGKPGDLGDAFEVCTVAADCKAGSSGSAADGPGGELKGPQAIAIDQSTGDLYVLDRDNRITQFSIDDNGTPADSADDLPVFERAFGWDAVVPGGAGEVLSNERKRLAYHPDWPAVGGTFILSFAGQTTAPIAFDAGPAAVQSALEALAGLAPGDVAVSGSAGGPWTFDFAGAYAGLDVGSFGVDGSGLVGTKVNSFSAFFNSEGNSPYLFGQILTVFNGAGYEICTVASQCQAGEPGRDAGAVDGSALAVAPAGSAVAGDLFLADTKNARVEQFGPAGAFVRAWGWGIDSGADQFEVCTAASLCQAAVPRNTPTGSQDVPRNGQFAIAAGGGDSITGNRPTEIAVDSSGVVYASNGSRSYNAVASGTGFRIERFDSTKSSAAQLLLPDPIGTADPPPGFPAGPLPGSEPGGLEVDPGNDHLYYLAGSGAGIAEIDATTDPDAPVLVDAHMQGVEPNVAVTGLGYDDGADRLYVSVSEINGGDPVNRVVAVGNAGPPPPVLTVETPSGVGAHQVTLKGTVNPNGPPSIETSYRFEYRRVGNAVWIQIPKTPIDLGDGSSSIAVEQTPTGLEACADYETRLFAQRTFGAGTTASAPQSFKTSCIAPEADTLAPQRLTDTEATFAADLNPNNLTTSYRFEYVSEAEFGANGYLNATLAPLPDASATGGAVLRVATDVEGLEPSTAYRVRIVAANAQGQALGDDVAFTTKPAADAAPQRGFEMVTPPFKTTRAGVATDSIEGFNPNVGLPSLDGEAILWRLLYFPLDGSVGSPADGDQRLLHRTAGGWVSETLNTLSFLPGTDPLLQGHQTFASSGDLLTQALRVTGSSSDLSKGGMLPTEGNLANRFYTRRPGTGTLGYTPWLTNPEQQQIGGANDAAIVNDDGSAMLRWGRYKGLGEDPTLAGDEDPSDEISFSGGMVYLQRAADPDLMPSAPKLPVNVCTGAGASSTQLPSRLGSGTATDTIGSRNCEAVENTRLTSTLGATGGGGSGDKAAEGPAATAISEDGRRVFFESPDPFEAPTACSTGPGAFTSCPPQLYVRSYDSEGNATVRWISRAQGTGTQRIAEMGAGVGFQGASRDGGYVYFKTNAPLLPGDPNGGDSITTGSASNSSWDLYRYELPGSLDEDPANGTLTRISGGPGGSADPGTNSSEGSGAPLRFLSDDGKRAYFVTTSPIAGADETPPAGGSTAPGGSVGNSSTRNLYLFDDDEEGAAKYRFIAQIPFDTATNSVVGALNSCAGYSTGHGYLFTPLGNHLVIRGSNCVHGTPDGSAVVLFTAGRLTGDDNDDAGDVYLYDALADELTRVSAPHAGAGTYACGGDGGPSNPSVPCNGDLGFSPAGSIGSGPAGGAGDSARGWGGMRYANIAKDAQGRVSVFFESRSSLVAADTNGDRWDVYQWRAGRLSLISPGDSADHSYYSGNSTDGQDVFIWTSARIDPREIDPTDYDLYDVREGGGFPPPPVVTPCDVLALQCEGQAAPADLADPAGGADRLIGPGNVAPGKARCGKGKVRRKGRCTKVKPRKHKGRHRQSKGGRR